MTLVRCYPIGVMKMTDGGAGDEKIIAIPWADPTYEAYTDISELPKHIFEEIKHFFTVYKDLEGKRTAVDEFEGALGAVRSSKNASTAIKRNTVRASLIKQQNNKNNKKNKKIE